MPRSSEAQNTHPVNCFACSKPILEGMHRRGNNHRNCELAAFMLDNPRLRPQEAAKLFLSGAVKESRSGSNTRRGQLHGIPEAWDANGNPVSRTQAARVIRNGEERARTWNERRSRNGGGRRY